MLNNLFESLLYITRSLEIRFNLYFCSPPFPYINQQKYQLKGQLNSYFDNRQHLQISIIFIHTSLNTIAIYPYNIIIEVDYQYEYQINKFFDFALNPTYQLTLPSQMYRDIEMGVEHIYSISKTHPPSPSILFPKLRIIDLNGLEELYNIQFESQIERVFVFQIVLLQSENKLLYMQNQRLQNLI